MRRETARGRTGAAAAARTSAARQIMWRPAHRPLQYTQAISVDQGPRKYEWLIWRSGIQQTSQGDLRMVTEWANLPFIVRNPCLNSADVQTAPSDLSGGLRYVSIEPFRGG